MVQHSLSMREVPGSTPGYSISYSDKMIFYVRSAYSDWVPSCKLSKSLVLPGNMFHRVKGIIILVVLK